MIKRLVTLLLILSSHFLYAQTVKTDALVIGSGAGGVAAAIQCARSKVKTILADDGFKISGSGITGQMVTVEENNDIPSGIWGEFRRHIRETYSKTAGYDTAENAALRFDPGTGSSTLKKITDTVKNLTVYQNSAFTAIKKDGDRWEVNLIQNGKTITIKARVVIDATEAAMVAEKAGGKIRGAFDQKANSNTKLYRTSIATGMAMPGQLADEKDQGFPAFYIPISSLLVTGVENILVTEKVLPGNKNIQDLPLQLQIGQGAGTIAAFCAFFKTTTQHLNARTIQGELLDFKGYLLPFTDVKQSDPAWRAVQQVSATGMLIGGWREAGNTAKFIFKPDSAVSTAEVKPVLTELYTRAFLWFNKEKPGEKFTVGNTLSFISDYTLTDINVLRNSMQKAWKAQYKFKSDFDLNRPISRREFAVLTNRFLNPFARTVDLSGRLIN
ncbi:MAG: FAD-dependent oxidoreductase [Bacteroidota bacterium]|nr:FAD-dependent oxidoreductase [Bacteroidota bacterium]